MEIVCLLHAALWTPQVSIQLRLISSTDLSVPSVEITFSVAVVRKIRFHVTTSEFAEIDFISHLHCINNAMQDTARKAHKTVNFSEFYRCLNSTVNYINTK